MFYKLKPIKLLRQKVNKIRHILLILAVLLVVLIINENQKDEISRHNFQ